MLLENPDMWSNIFTISSMSAFMLTLYMDLCTSGLFFFIPMWVKCSCFSALSFSTVGIIIVLPFIAMPSKIAVSSLNDWYDYKSFCNPQNMSFDTMPKCSSSGFANLIFSSIMLSNMTMYDYCVDRNAHALELFISVSWLCLSIQSAVYGCGPCL